MRTRSCCFASLLLTRLSTDFKDKPTSRSWTAYQLIPSRSFLPSPGTRLTRCSGISTPSYPTPAQLLTRLRTALTPYHSHVRLLFSLASHTNSRTAPLPRPIPAAPHSPPPAPPLNAPLPPPSRSPDPRPPFDALHPPPTSFRLPLPYPPTVPLFSTLDAASEPGEGASVEGKRLERFEGDVAGDDE